MQTEQLLCWSRMTDAEHTATSGSNEVVIWGQLERSKICRIWTVARWL